ncbi:anti-sigma factor [uncultured Nonlabens sp.]|uniref:anti-sigma factor n=1 Tax=uncultured Nonlabens sp. TaxID=859306 RepID=UPI00261BE20A|nr:anti-sigma factor [uncultured Nonlabens sp.]
MDTQELINSGDLELYVCGVLDLERSIEITQQIKNNISLQLEIQQIEETYIKLAKGLAPATNEMAVFDKLQAIIGDPKNEKTTRDSSWSNYMGWAAAAALLIGSGYLYLNNTNLLETNSTLENQIVTIEQEKDFLSTEMEQTKEVNNDYQEALAFIKDKNTRRVDLAGQKGFEDTYATAFHNAVKNVTYIDVAGLPPAPQGKSYQLWSLTLNPLTPTSLGVVENSNDLIRVENANATEAFGITLEEYGGAAGPNLEQLYTLGVIN